MSSEILLCREREKRGRGVSRKDKQTGESRKLRAGGKMGTSGAQGQSPTSKGGVEVVEEKGRGS